MHDLLPLINAENQDLQASAYVCLQYLCEYADHDEVAYNMMNELVCVDSIEDDPVVSLQNARFSAVLLEMFGKSLERMTRARDWMLYLTLLANFFVTHIDVMARNLIQQDSSLESSSAWDTCCILYSNSCLDLVHFIHSQTVAKDPFTFPVRVSASVTFFMQQCLMQLDIVQLDRHWKRRWRHQKTLFGLFSYKCGPRKSGSQFGFTVSRHLL